MSEHEQIRELIEGYALGALDAQERASLEAHLASGCADCAKALEEARWAASQLAYLAPEEQPSELLKGRLMQTVRADAAGSSSSGAMRDREGSGAGKQVLPGWLWAGVAALLLFSVYSAWNGQRQRDVIIDLQKQMEAQHQQRAKLEQELFLAKTQAAEALIWSDPKSVKIKLPAKDPNMPMLEAMWHPEMGLCVKGWNVPPAGKNRVLQLWLIPKKGKPMPSTTFWPDASGTFTTMVGNPPVAMGETQALAITEEPMGGSPQPTSTPMWVGGVS